MESLLSLKLDESESIGYTLKYANSFFRYNWKFTELLLPPSKGVWEVDFGDYALTEASKKW